ncbi:substrate-binding periplasmic protein [Aestuariibacter salexigens]|uniref:substrate-binding periplasmic protein n=1 Tax=Aestuariibacter salexigens TaxID=226010 RepID=UPI000401238B|nr:transporter substrate-binding domain-containing protein [Aestuariibacter salexigens]
MAAFAAIAAFIFFSLISISDVQATEKTLKITLPYIANDEQRNLYIEQVVTRAADATGHTVQIAHFDLPTNESRIQKMLQDGTPGIDVAWMPVTKERIDTMLFVPISLYSGLHGNRLLLIHADRQADFAALTSLQALAKMIGLQYQHWAEYRVLIENGLQIHGDLKYSDMFRAIDSGLADYLPRSALTIKDELKRSQSTSIAVEGSLVLVYPSYYFLFVNKANPELASALSTGMRMMRQQGTLQTLFEDTYGERLDGLALQNRRVFSLNNSDIPETLLRNQDTQWRR